MPKELTDEWKIELGEDWEETYEDCLNILGNLTLTGYNSEMSNNTFSKKKKYLNESNFQLNKYFQSIDHWNQTAIENRGEELAERALTSWPVFYIGKEASPVSATTQESKPTKLLIFGKEYPIEHWNDLPIKIFEAMIVYKENDFDSFAASLPTHVKQSRFSNGNSRKLSNGYWVYINYSAKESLRIFNKVIDNAGLSDNDFELVYE